MHSDITHSVTISSPTQLAPTHGQDVAQPTSYGEDTDCYGSVSTTNTFGNCNACNSKLSITIS